jgi:osmoprotectant transport system ATP-binding protein
MAAIRFRSVTRSFTGTRVLDDIDLDIPAGSVTAILGESGCGKSTLLNHINGILVPDSGRVEVFGDPIDYGNLQALRRRMGYAVQSVGLFPHLHLYENVTLAARIFGWEKAAIRKRMTRLMELLKLEPQLEQRYPHELSGGQRQRAGLARALMLRPELLLLDEPFSGIDPIARLSIHREFQALLAEEPATTVLVTHDAREAVKLAGNLVILGSGQVLQQGPTRSVLADPATEFIAQLFEDIT